MRKEIKKALECIIDKNDADAKKYIKEGIQKNFKYQNWKKQLSEMGLDYKKVLVEDIVYDNIKIILEKFDKNLQLKILDIVYQEISEDA